MITAFRIELRQPEDGWRLVSTVKVATYEAASDPVEAARTAAQLGLRAWRDYFGQGAELRIVELTPFALARIAA